MVKIFLAGIEYFWNIERCENDMPSSKNRNKDIKY